ncbi:hypothetical protein DsansV1_C23g0177701 [Dioscorea sansibarensis]
MALWLSGILWVVQCGEVLRYGEVIRRWNLFCNFVWKRSRMFTFEIMIWSRAKRRASQEH